MFVPLRLTSLLEGVVVGFAVLAIVLGAAFLPGVAISGGLLAQESGAKKAGKSKTGADEKAKKETEEKAKNGPAEQPPDENDGTAGKADPGADEGKGAKKKAGTKAALSIDEEYIQENLQNFLHPTAIQWLDDGRVKMSFDFTQKNEDHESIFIPKISKEVNSKFRWSVRYEYGWGYTGTTSKSTDYWYGGLRMGMEGQAMLNCWFTDDVEVEATYAQFVSHSAKQLFAVSFTNDGGKSIASNFGTQTATFTKNRLDKAKGTVDQVLNEQGLVFKLLVKDGSFEAFRDGKSKQKQEYSKKTYASGRVGFIWGGGIASIVHKMDVTGRIDAKRMATQLRKLVKK